MSNESMLPSKLGKNLKVNTLIYKTNPHVILRECPNSKEKQLILLKVY